MLSFALIVSLSAALWSGLPAATQEDPSAGLSQPEPAAQIHALVLAPLEGDRLDPALAALVPGLLAAALESGEGYQVTSDQARAGWQVRLAVSGKGPWRLWARAEPRSGSGRSPRIASKKVSFSNRENLPRAIDDLTADLDTRWREADPSAPAQGQPMRRPAPLESALSSSTKAVDAYLEALAGLRSGDLAEAGPLLDEALAADPSFTLAAAERIFTDLTLGRLESAREALENAQSAAALGRSPLATAVIEALEKLLAGEPARALQKGEYLRMRAPHILWGRTIHGLALEMLGRRKEALQDWSILTTAYPEDTRYRMQLGLSGMAAGDFKMAAEAFDQVRSRWPDQLQVYTLQAEAQVRMRETAAARQTLTEMKTYMSSQGIAPSSDALNPDLMLGSVDLMEGHFISGLKRFEDALEALTRSGASDSPTGTLYAAIVQLRRDLIASRDPLTRGRQVDDAMKVIDRYESTLSDQERRTPGRILLLRGLIHSKEGNTVEAWKLVDRIKSGSESPGYTEYHEAYLSGAIMLKEGDIEGATAQFERAAKATGRIVEMMDVAQMQSALRRYEEARRTFQEIERSLESYDTSPGSKGGQELVLADPHLAALVPAYHYARARLAFETSNPAESRYHFNRMLKYLQNPDEGLLPLVKEARGRGATPE